MTVEDNVMEVCVEIRVNSAYALLVVISSCLFDNGNTDKHKRYIRWPQPRAGDDGGNMMRLRR